MSLLIVYQVHGRLPGRPNMTSFPFLVPYIALNLYVLMSVGHKEQRFMASIFPVFAIFWSFFWVVILRGCETLHENFTPKSSFGFRQLGRLIYQMAFFAYFCSEMFLSVKDQLNFH